MAASAPWLVSRSIHSNVLTFATSLNSPASPSSSASHLLCSLLTASRFSTHCRRCADRFPSKRIHNNNAALNLSSEHSVAERGSGGVRARSLAAMATSADNVKENGTTISQVRVRFAPSPTGNLHVGGARTALFNYLFAK